MNPQKSVEQFRVSTATKTIDASYMQLEFAKAASTKQAYSDLESARAIAAKHGEKLGADVLLVDFSFVVTDRDETMASVMVTNLLMAGIGVFGATLLLVHPLLAAFIFFVVFLIDIDLFGLMVIWHMKVDVTAFICVAMALGLSVDYVIHIAT